MPKAASSLVQRSASGLSEATAMPQPRPRSARKISGVSACMRTLRPAASLTSQPPTCHARRSTQRNAPSQRRAAVPLSGTLSRARAKCLRILAAQTAALCYPAAVVEGAHTRT